MVEQKWQFKLASQEQCERLKRNFGGWRTIMPYLKQTEQVSLQGLDHYTYETGVPRAAETSFTVGGVYYFLRDQDSGKIDSLEVPSNRVRTYIVEGMGMVEAGTCNAIEGMDQFYGAVQTRKGLIVVGFETTWLMTKSKDSDELLKAPRKAPPVQHIDFALTAFGDTHLVYMGGRKAVVMMPTTLFYNLQADEWKKGPDLNEARYHHSSCSLGDFTYVIAGNNAINNAIANMTNSIERLNAKESILETACSSLTHQWERVQVSGATLNPCVVPLVCQLRGKELLILGGQEGNDRRALALHQESLELRLLSDGLSMNVSVEYNQVFKLSNNKVAASNYNKDDDHYYVITYTSEEPDTIQIVEDLGYMY